MIKTHLQAMVDNGYNCLPIKPNTKRPDVAGWSNIELTPELYTSWLERKPDHGIGLRLGDGLYCVDIDVKDAACVDSLVVDLDFSLGLSGFQRIGFAPKTNQRKPRLLRQYQCNTARPPTAIRYHVQVYALTKMCKFQGSIRYSTNLQHQAAWCEV